MESGKTNIKTNEPEDCNVRGKIGIGIELEEIYNSFILLITFSLWSYPRCRYSS